MTIMNHKWNVNLTGAYIFIVLSIGLLLASCESTIYIVRHAEKQSGNNPHLTENGQSRAQTLSDTLSTKRINLVMTTDSNRTRETAQPTASRFNLPLTIYGKDTIPGLVGKLKNTWGKNILIVSHSETIPVIVQQFGYTLQSPITGFNRLIIIKRVKNKPELNTYKETTYGNP